MEMMLTTASHYAIRLQRLLVLLLLCFASILPIINASTTTTTATTSPIPIQKAFESSDTTKPTFVTALLSAVKVLSEQIKSTMPKEQVIESIVTSTTTSKNEAELNRNMNHDKLSFLDDLRRKYSHQPTFLQSVEEIALSLLPLFDDPDKGEFYRRAFVAMTEPERILAFRIPWVDDNGNMQFNRGWRIEFSR